MRCVFNSVYFCVFTRFVIELASRNKGVIISNDEYKDFLKKKPHFKEVIQDR